MSQTRQLAAIMFTDIVGYTALMGDVEENAFNLLDKNRKLQKPIIESYGGKWIKELGDGVLATFSTVSDAVYCALAIQQGSNIDPDLNLRIGIHLGEVVFQDGDVFGDGVNIASRLESLAPTGGIWVSEAVSRNIQNKDGIETLFVREEELKNVKDPVKVYEIRVEGVVLPTPRDVSRVSEPTKQKSFNKVIYLGLAIFIFAFILYLGYSKFYNSPPAADVSIAVLAFADMSPNKDQEYFSDGISEELLNLLSKTPELRVISRTSSFSYKGKDYTAEEIGRELKVTYLLEGSIRKSENTIRITAQLINAIDGSHIWSETYDRDLEDVFNIQDEIGAEVTKKLQLTILGIQPKIKTVDTEAYTMYLKARHLIHQNTKQAYLTAENIIKQSLEVDSSYAPSWELLGYIYNTGSYNFLTKPKAEAFELGIAAVQKAIELDPKFSAAYASLASLYEKTWEFEEAKKNIKRALELGPNNSEIIGSIALSPTISLEKSITLLKRAIKLDPNMYIHYYNLAHHNFLANHLDEAEEALNTFVLYYPNAPLYHYIMSRILIARGKWEEALIESKQESHPFFLLYGKNFATFALGKRVESDSLLAKLIDIYGNTDPANIADIYAFRGEIENSFIWLDKAINVKDPVLLEALNYPSFKILYKDPRWNELINRIGL